MKASKCLEELEGRKLERPEYDSNLIKECVRLWSVPISELSIENLRMLIGQNLGLKYLVPVALDILSENPFVAGNMYKGDLLVNLVKIPDDFWRSNLELNNQLVEIKSDLEEVVETITQEIMPYLKEREYL